MGWIMNEEKTSVINEDREDIDQRRPKPYRYITKDEIASVDQISEDELCGSVMSNEQITTTDILAKRFETTLGVGDMQKVEEVLERHQKQRSEMKK